ncbi:Transcriptional regulatory protein LnrK [Austwickia sp. TVS 96-490-7B]|uniref:response regulator n=1 Tax=Austwickia sp. TVS 96-490-7B TaxID=2830843 RepID=UPI001C57F81B|nr:response regulator transcription factor [Austwickia sp. TVS 96-490-7B]MBW3084057.1 Transcriptional regulatory protein LnrK [Austwickia sp. TVS 96-490-7B]
MPMTRVLIVEDQQLILDALERLIRAAADMTVVGVARTGVEAIEQAESLSPDVILMDLQLPVMNGIDATRRITSTDPTVKVIAVTTFTSPEAVVPALCAGAAGYLSKSGDPRALVPAIRDVLAGRHVLSSAVTAALVEAVRARPSLARSSAVACPDDPAASLTARESDVLNLLAQGLSNAEMATELCITEAAVKSRIIQLTTKLGVDSRVQLLVRSIELGLVRPRLRRPDEPIPSQVPRRQVPQDRSARPVRVTRSGHATQRHS